MITRPRRERLGGGTSVVGPQGGGGYWAGVGPGVHCWAGGGCQGASAPVCCGGEFHPGGAGGVGMAGGADIGDGRGNVIAAVSAAFGPSGPSGSIAAGGIRPGGSGPGDSVARGMASMPGIHTMRMSHTGIQVFPRTPERPEDMFEPFANGGLFREGSLVKRAWRRVRGRKKS